MNEIINEIDYFLYYKKYKVVVMEYEGFSASEIKKEVELHST